MASSTQDVIVRELAQRRRSAVDSVATTGLWFRCRPKSGGYGRMGPAHNGACSAVVVLARPQPRTWPRPAARHLAFSTSARRRRESGAFVGSYDFPPPSSLDGAGKTSPPSGSRHSHLSGSAISLCRRGHVTNRPRRSDDSDASVLPLYGTSEGAANHSRAPLVLRPTASNNVSAARAVRALGTQLRAQCGYGVG